MGWLVSPGMVGLVRVCWILVGVCEWCVLCLCDPWGGECCVTRYSGSVRVSISIVWVGGTIGEGVGDEGVSQLCWLLSGVRSVLAWGECKYICIWLICVACCWCVVGGGCRARARARSR